MVKGLKNNGRLQVVPVGHWSSRFAEGARVSLYTDKTIHRGTILPLKASGHTFNEEIDTQPVSWDNLELRVDEDLHSQKDLEDLGIAVGDFIGIDSRPEILQNGFINARHLDDKAGVAALLTAAKFIVDNEIQLPVECHLLFTISEEVGSGASAVLHGDVAEMVSIDNGTVAPGQNSAEHGATITMADSTGPFDYHLTHHLLNLCQNNSISYQRDIFKYYRCDGASALEAGNDIRSALIAFGVDASHGYERTHMDALVSVASSSHMPPAALSTSSRKRPSAPSRNFLRPAPRRFPSPRSTRPNPRRRSRPATNKEGPIPSVRRFPVVNKVRAILPIPAQSVRFPICPAKTSIPPPDSPGPRN